MRPLRLLCLLPLLILPLLGKVSLTPREKAWMEKHPTVRVALDPHQSPFSFFHEGRPQGLIWDYLRLVAKESGLRFTPVRVDDSRQCQEHLETLRVDLISFLTCRRDCEPTIHTRPYYHLTYYLYLRRDEIRDFSFLQMKGKRFAYVPKYFIASDFRMHFPMLEYQEYPSAEMALDAIVSHRSDITILPQLVARGYLEHPHFTSIGKFDFGIESVPASFATTPENAPLISIMDKALAAIPETLLLQIRKRWAYDFFDRQAHERSNLTQSDLRYLRSLPTLRFGGDPNWLPFEAFDEKGRYIGIVAEFLKTIERKLGVSIERIPSRSWDESIANLKSGRIDILSETIDSDLGKSFLFTQPYLSTPIVIVTRSDAPYVNGLDTMKGRRVGVIRNYGYLPKIRKAHPDLEYREFPDIHRAFQALHHRKIDALLVTYALANYHIKKMGYDELKIAGKTGLETQLAFAVSPQYPRLVEIVNKILDQIPEAEKREISRRWFESNIIVRTDYTVALLVLAFSLTILFIILYLVYYFRKESRRQRRLQKALRLLNERFEKISSNTEGALYELLLLPDDTVEILYVSSGFRHLFGIDASEAESRQVSIFDFLDPTEHRELFSRIRQAELGEYFEYEAQIRVGDASKWIRTSFYIHDRDPGSGLILIDGFTVDISQLKENEAQLIRERNRAEVATRAKSEFLSNMSHEIRTPMNAIIGFSELMESTPLDATQRRYLESIRLSSKNLLRLINDILDLSKIEAGKIELHYAPVDLHGLLAELERIFSLKLQKKRLRFILDEDEEIPRYLVLDETRLRQILFNLLGNAVKFTERGHIAIRTRLLKHDDAQGTVDLEICVEDTGIGIPPDQQKKIFEPFRQQDGQSSRKYGGTGLGLGISNKLATLMGGELLLESRPGEGSTFRLRLRGVHAAQAPAETGRETSPRYRFDGASILVVEDLELNHRYLRDALERLGASVTVATDGHEALQLLRERTFDLILMDLNMPGMDGYEAVRLIRDIPRYARLPILALSASVMPEEIERALGSGFDRFLEKPILLEELQEALAIYLPHTVERDEVPSKREGAAIDRSAWRPTPPDAEGVTQLHTALERLRHAYDSGSFDQMGQALDTLEALARNWRDPDFEHWCADLRDSLQQFDIEAMQELIDTLTEKSP